MNGKYLITTDHWFYAPDGKKYRAVWGEVEILGDSVLGVATNRNSANWFAKVGSEETHIIIAGCQIHYAIRTENKPDTDMLEDVSYGESSCVKYQRPSEIYIFE